MQTVLETIALPENELVVVRSNTTARSFTSTNSAPVDSYSEERSDSTLLPHEFGPTDLGEDSLADTNNYSVSAPVYVINLHSMNLIHHRTRTSQILRRFASVSASKEH